jgi:hypothetical protein
MTATDFYIHYPEYVMPPLTIPSVAPPDRKAALRQILLDHPECIQVFMRCWYEGTLPEPTTPFRLRRR